MEKTPCVARRLTAFPPPRPSAERKYSLRRAHGFPRIWRPVIAAGVLSASDAWPLVCHNIGCTSAIESKLSLRSACTIFRPLRRLQGRACSPSPRTKVSQAPILGFLSVTRGYAKLDLFEAPKIAHTKAIYVRLCIPEGGEQT